LIRKNDKKVISKIKKQLAIQEFASHKPNLFFAQNGRKISLSPSESVLNELLRRHRTAFLSQISTTLKFTGLEDFQIVVMDKQKVLLRLPGIRSEAELKPRAHIHFLQLTIHAFDAGARLSPQDQPKLKLGQKIFLGPSGTNSRYVGSERPSVSDQEIVEFKKIDRWFGDDVIRLHLLAHVAQDLRHNPYVQRSKSFALVLDGVVIAFSDGAPLRASGHLDFVLLDKSASLDKVIDSLNASFFPHHFKRVGAVQCTW